MPVPLLMFTLACFTLSVLLSGNFFFLPLVLLLLTSRPILGVIAPIVELTIPSWIARITQDYQQCPQRRFIEPSRSIFCVWLFFYCDLCGSPRRTLDDSQHGLVDPSSVSTFQDEWWRSPCLGAASISNLIHHCVLSRCIVWWYSRNVLCCVKRSVTWGLSYRDFSGSLEAVVGCRGTVDVFETSLDRLIWLRPG